MQLSARSTLAALMLCAGAAASAQTTVVLDGPRANQHPDVIVSSVGGSYDTTSSNAIAPYGVSGGITAYAIGSDSCNVGTDPAVWVDVQISSTSGSTTTIVHSNQHPVIGGQLYRLYNGRFEQIGMSWLKHGFCAADSCSSGNSSGGLQGCLNVGGNPPGSTGCSIDRGNPSGLGQTCDWLGYGRATDTYVQSLNGTQGYLGPRSEVNAWTGTYPYPYVRQGSNPVSCLNKRLLVANADLDATAYPRYNASTNPSGAQFFSEIVYIVTDEWPTERYNNYSYRRINAAATTSTSSTSGCTGAYYPLSYTTGAGNLTVATHPAIDAWRTADPSVVIATADAPNDGRFYVGSKVTDLGNGSYQYEYAVFNMNSDRAAGSFAIPKANSSAVQISNVGFRAPSYHSGEPYASTPWTGTVSGTSVTWSTDSYTTNANANAVRWSTLYNFRFTATRPAKTGSVQLGLFKPAVQPGDASSITVSGVLVPGDPPPCVADYNSSGAANLQDIFDFLSGWFAGDPHADTNGVGGITIQDIFDFLSAWFTGCP